MSNHESEPPAYLNIFGQYFPHDFVQIMGNRPALIALRNAIDATLGGEDESIPSPIKEHQSVNVYTSDGEGYVVCVTCRTDPAMQKTRTPYFE